MIPGAFVSLVLALGAFRLTRLVGWDDLPPIQRFRDRLTGQSVRYSSTESREPIVTFRRPVLAHFLGCPYCVGFWISLAAYGAWLWQPRVTLYVLAPLALSAAVGIIARQLDP